MLDSEGVAQGHASCQSPKPCPPLFSARSSHVVRAPQLRVSAVPKRQSLPRVCLRPLLESPSWSLSFLTPPHCRPRRPRLSSVCVPGRPTFANSARGAATTPIPGSHTSSASLFAWLPSEAVARESDPVTVNRFLPPSHAHAKCVRPGVGRIGLLCSFPRA